MTQLNRFDKVLIALLLVMAIVFAVVYGVVISREGYEYMESILLPSQSGSSTVYSGTIDGKEASFTITADKQVTFRHGNKVYGPYTAKEDPTAIPEDHEYAAYMTGLEVKKGDKIIFRGGYINTTNHSGWMYYNEDGSPASTNIKVYASNGVSYDENGNVIDPMEPSVSQIMALMRGVKLTHKGNWVFYFVCLLFSIVTVVSVIFSDEIFRWRLRFYVRDADRVEPSDWMVAGRYVGWTILVVVYLVFYIKGLQ